MGTRKKKGRTEKQKLYSYRERQGKNRETKAKFIEGKTREELKNITNIHVGKDKERTEKHYPYSYRERQGKNRNKSHIYRGKDKGRTEKHYPYQNRERRGKNRETKAIFIEGKT